MHGCQSFDRLELDDQMFSNEEVGNILSNDLLSIAHEKGCLTAKRNGPLAQLDCQRRSIHALGVPGPTA